MNNLPQARRRWLKVRIAFLGLLLAVFAGRVLLRAYSVQIAEAPVIREHVQRLQTLGPVWPGRYRWDAAGNIATEAGQWLFNFNTVVAQRGSNPYYRSDVTKGQSVFVGKKCTAVHGRLSPGDSNSSYSYYVGC